MANANLDQWQSGRTLSESLSIMLDKNIATDVTFKFQNTEATVTAHRLILMARSRAFYTMFNSGLDEPRVVIEINDIDPNIFEEFLRYLYSEDTTLSTEKALHFTYCAEKYKITDLKAECTNFLQSVVDDTTVAKVLDHAVLYNDDALISTCQAIIMSVESLSCLQRYHVHSETMALVLRFEGLPAGEVDIFRCCNTWAEKECQKRGVAVNARNKREMLGPLLSKIPFCSMTQEQFATEVSGTYLLNAQEELQVFRFICALDKSNPPFPCKPKELIFVKLPNMRSFPSHTTFDFQRRNPTMRRMYSSFKLAVSCTKAFTLLGLEFTQAGNYRILFDDTVENFSIHEYDLKGFLKTPMQFAAGQQRTIQTDEAATLQQARLYTHAERVNGQTGYIELDFSLTAHGQPPFNILILQV